MATDDEQGAAKPGEEEQEPRALVLEATPPAEDDEESWIEPADPPEGPRGEHATGPHPLTPPRERAAERPRQAELELPAPEETEAHRGVRLVIAFASGKGGVGKSLLAASVGVYLAQLGREVVLVDGAIGAGTLHTLVGSSGPGPSLQQFINREIKELADAIVPTPFPGLGLVSGLNDGFGAANPRPAQKNRLLSQLRALPTDYVILDLSAGTGFNVLDMFLAADLQVVVVVPEPTSIECGFRLIKNAFLRRVRGVNGIDKLLEATAPTAHFGLPTPHQLHRAAGDEHPELRDAVHDVKRSFKPRLLVNQCRAREDLEIGPQLALLGRRHLGLPIDYVGYVDHDDAVWVAMRRRRPLQVEFPEAKVCKDIDRVTRRLLALENKEEPTCVQVPAVTDELTHYELFGIHPGATDEEIRRSHRWLRRIYDAHSNAVYGVAPPEEVAAVHKRIEEAYATLVDGEKRHRYDQQLFPEAGGQPDASNRALQQPRAAAEQRLLAHAAELDATPVEMPEIDEATEFSGAMLRQIREARGVELREMAEKTKITMSHLRAIEEEDFHNVLAPVYLRGFVKAVAQCLKLDPDRVARSYMQRYGTAREG